ncbi:TetR/AcrR family transcriptional regulator C-terminal domain-containing protein [Galbitalea sp. SE-J8]|uniref:TetR/AcrR family transcriptional regulator C-terminal domain-containing protein n=1 Tax=Galbitalea sp. SE-J8 TaxID=3054952 RepID=UPI00259D06F1|nr:TetR/AcrR family transcriptional regulator C-terminal domain-containing protein [Galbitalea sp. SE-J8]MDM4762017.1 TetR/AcrR family transcriptional regulator C-terminal domain-containing protein [Galbitalea sp. SE-J8]
MAVDRERVVSEAVALLDAEGLDGVTTRRLAARLGVQSPTLYWHVPNKAALVTAIADAILADLVERMSPPAPDEPWPDWLTALAHGLRAALLAHPDGARVISAAQLSAAMNALSELAISALVAAGVPLRHARVITLATERFTIGYVLEEQAPRPDAAALGTWDLAEFTAAHPTLIAGITDYFDGDRTPDDLFRDCLRIVVDGAAVAGGPGRSSRDDDPL